MSPPNSRPPTPKSVRPPLPERIDAELRAACAYLVTHPRPSHRAWDEQPKPALDYATIKSGGEPVAARPARSAIIRAKAPLVATAAAAAAAHDIPLESTKYTYKPYVPINELFKQHDHERAPPLAIARSRVDQIMAPEPTRSMSTGIRVRAHSDAVRDDQRQQRHHHHHHQRTPLTRVQAEKGVKIPARSDSIGTTGSTPKTDSTDDPFSASTPGTSVAITPTRSKRTSSQIVNSSAESDGAARVVPANTEWMRRELQNYKRLMDGFEKTDVQAEAIQLGTDVKPIQLKTQAATPIPQPYPGKSGPSLSEDKQQTDLSGPNTHLHSRFNDTQPWPRRKSDGKTKDSRSQPARAEADCVPATDTEPRGRWPTRSSSVVGRAPQAASRAVSRAASRAASRAGCITNDILNHYFGIGSPTTPTDHGHGRIRRRSSSRTGHIADQMKGYSRDQSGMLSTYFSEDHTQKAPSDPPNSTHPKDLKGDHRQPLQSQTRAQVTTPEASRPVGSSVTEQTLSMQGPRAVPAYQRGRASVDLNRKLPPLPRLGHWGSVEKKQQKTTATQGGQMRQALPAHVRTGSIPRFWSQGDQNRTGRLRRLSTEDGEERRGGRLANSAKSPSGLRPMFSRVKRSPNADHLDTEVTANLSLIQHSRAVADGPTNPAKTARSKGVKGLRSSVPHEGSGDDSRDQRPVGSHTSRSNPDQDVHEARYLRTVEMFGPTNRCQFERDTGRRKWWQASSKTERRGSWMDEVERQGAKNGMVLADGVAARPIA